MYQEMKHFVLFHYLGSLLREDRQSQKQMDVFQRAKTAKVEELMERLVDTMEDASAKITDTERTLYSQSPVHGARHATENVVSVSSL